jgi:TonB family protein
LSTAAQAAHVTGIFIARCRITESGSVDSCSVVKGLPHMDDHVVRTLQQQKFTPVIFEGKPQAVWYTFKITFK